MYIIHINTNNAAFEFQEGVTIARILRKLADDCESNNKATDGFVRDVNGKSVGWAKTRT